MNTFDRLTLMVRLANRARRAKMHASTCRIIGLTGRVETPIAPDGTIFVRGELWPARAPEAIARGEIVRVIGMNNLVLDVIRTKANRTTPDGCDSPHPHGSL